MNWRYHLLEWTEPQKPTQIASWTSRPSSEDVSRKLIEFGKRNTQYSLVEIIDTIWWHRDGP